VGRTYADVPPEILRKEKIMTIKKYRWDIIVISLLLLIALAAFAISLLTREEGNVLEVEINGTVTAKYPLSIDGTYTLNGGTNTLTIKGGVAYITYSDCPDHICENKRGIHYVGQKITCLPNHLTITVRGEMTDEGVDF
jgi:hypothetical protein